MKWVVEEAPTEAKLRLLSSMFPQKIVYDGESYRTTAVNKVLDLIYQQTNELRGSKKVKEGKSCDLSSVVPGTGLEPALLSKYAPETYASTNSAIRARGVFGAQDKT